LAARGVLRVGRGPATVSIAQVREDDCLASSQLVSNDYETTDPDARLMLRVRDDHAPAFEELVRRYQGRLMAIFHNTFGSREQAEDLVQEVFLRVFRARHSYTADAKFSTWLFTIAHNVAKNAKRTKARRREVTVVGDDSGPMSANPLEQMAQAASGQLPTRQVDRMERAEMVRLAMETLNERQRLAVLLSKFESMSYADIGAAMGLSVPAIKSLLTRARTNLRMVLEPYIQEGTALSDTSHDSSAS
jgi:RNA polymerase sigma-70 factor (ECF subfamily)